ncbi:hypothetical protein [Microcoleus sp. herbarium2]
MLVGNGMLKEEGRRKKEEGRRKREEGRRKKEEGKNLSLHSWCAVAVKSH